MVELGVAAAGGQELRRGCPARRSGRASITRIRSASRIVDRRWAMTMAVRPARASASAACTSASEVGVEVGGGLVEDHHPRLGQQDPGDGQALALAAGEAGSPARPPRCRARRAATATRSASRACARASHSSSSVASGRAKRRLSRTVSWNRWPSWVTRPSVPRMRVEGQVADVDARQPHRPAVDVVEAGRQRGDGRLAAARGARRGPPAGPARPGTTRRGAPRRRRGCRGWRPPPARPATPCRPTGRRSGRRRTRATPGRRARSTASGVSSMSGSRSSTSKTRSKLTRAVMASTRALARAVSGA